MTLANMYCSFTFNTNNNTKYVPILHTRMCKHELGLLLAIIYKISAWYTNTIGSRVGQARYERGSSVEAFCVSNDFFSPKIEFSSLMNVGGTSFSLPSPCSLSTGACSRAARVSHKSNHLTNKGVHERGSESSTVDPSTVRFGP